jgi:hypothetical protein
MNDNIIRFPSFILLDDRNTILKDGKRYKSIKAVIADLPHRDLQRTHDWYGKRAWPLSYRARRLRTRALW